MRGIEPPCAAWEAAVLPLNYTREEIFDFRFALADCNRNKFALQIAVACAVLSASSRDREVSVRWGQRTLQREMRKITAMKSRHLTRCSRFYRLNHRLGLDQETSR